MMSQQVVRTMEKEEARTRTSARLFFVDNLRVFLIGLVFLDHLATVYGSPFGVFYFREGQVDAGTAHIYGLFQGVLQAFFMGLLFLYSGYFTPSSYDRKGARQFLKDRLIRLGIPLAVFATLVNPVVKYAVALAEGSFHGSFFAFVGASLPFGVGPLWFVLALLLFDAAYVVWRQVSAGVTGARAIPGNYVLFGFALSMGVVAFAVRVFFPAGWYDPHPLLDFQYAYFPQYVALFIAGVLACRGNWLMSLPKRTGLFWQRAALALLALFPLILVAGIRAAGTGPQTTDMGMFFGGLHWQAAAYAVWEELFCVAVAVGLSSWFREKLNFQNRFTKALSDSSYAAYVIQAPVIVFLTLSLRGIQMPLLLKFVAVSPLVVALCFLCAYLLRKIPRVDRVL